MLKEYPKMVYRTREDYKVVNNIDEEEFAAGSGYGEFEIMVLGRKPEGIDPVADEPMDVLIEEYKKTGGRPIKNGKPTAKFEEWLKENGHS